MGKRKTMVNKKVDYSLLIGFWKTFSNGLIWLVPMIIVLLSNADDWIPNPESYAVITSSLLYLLKNYWNNR